MSKDPLLIQDPTVEVKRSPLFLDIEPTEIPVDDTGRNDVGKRTCCS